MLFFVLDWYVIYRQSLKLSSLIQLLGLLWTRCWVTVASYVVLCGSVPLLFHSTHYSSCDRQVLSLWLMQTIFISVGSYMTTGAAGTSFVSSSLAVLKPKTWGDGGRYAHYIPSHYIHWPVCTFLFPVIVTLIHTIFVFKI